MGSVLRIRNRELEDILCEGAQLIQHNIVTGFNFDQETAATQLALIVQYYHNVEEHISCFIEKTQELSQQHFGKPIVYERSRKWGFFKWMPGYDDEPGNKYYAIAQTPAEQAPLSFERIDSIEMLHRLRTGLVLAKDRSTILTFTAEDGTRARFLLDVIKKYCRKYIAGQKNPGRIDDYAHVNPFFILRDDAENVADKNDLELVYRLELKKGARIISSIVQQHALDDVLQKLRQFPCGLNVEQGKRYISKEFFSNY